jgi:hypothetical protein
MRGRVVVGASNGWGGIIGRRMPDAPEKPLPREKVAFEGQVDVADLSEIGCADDA